MIKTGTIIFSVFRNDLAEQVNTIMHDRVATFLLAANIDFTEVIGVYKGSEELSFVVSYTEESLIKILCEKFDQESYLKIRGNGYCWLEYSDGSSESIGKWKQVAEEVAFDSDSYTEVDGTFYVAA